MGGGRKQAHEDAAASREAAARRLKREAPAREAKESRLIRKGGVGEQTLIPPCAYRTL